ncbi:MAG TPA: DUF4215 domain-containing protein, partial [Kofleriaceae bacterium]|nr:DUF4215 domain-containing protein [Kofleriaceae bacterium]
QADGDGCDSNCTVTACGNGVVTAGEACDDGNRVGGDGCENDCTLTPRLCGNGRTDPGEACDDGNQADGDGCDSNCTVTACGNGVVTAGEACDDGNTSNWDGCDATCTPSAFTYVKASNTGQADIFGTSIALSADGSTLAVGAEESSAATGIDGDEADDSATAAGAVYVFTRSGTTWVQQAYLKASNTGRGDRFGTSVALSTDGSTLVVGAFDEDSDGDPGNNLASDSGAAYVFTRSGATWSQQAYLKAGHPDESAHFGTSVAISGDGATVAVGAFGESSGATGIDGDDTDHSARSSGAVYVFTRSDATWTQAAYVKASNTGASDAFGTSVALSGDGLTLAVGAVGEDSAATTIDGDGGDNSAIDAGAVYVFTQTGGTWRQQAYVKAADTARRDDLGRSVALSSDGSTLAVGARGVEAFAGAAYVFARSGTTWHQEAEVMASNAAANASFGHSIALSSDGSTLAVGAPEEASKATGVGGDQRDTSAVLAGAAYVFRRSAAAWSQQSYVKAFNTGLGDLFGESLALSGDGAILTVGATGEASTATGINHDQRNDDAPSAGAVYVYQ